QLLEAPAKRGEPAERRAARHRRVALLLSSARENTSHEPPVLGLELEQTREARAEREAAGIAGEDARDHRPHESRGGLRPEPPGREGVDRLVLRRTRTRPRLPPAAHLAPN